MSIPYLQPWYILRPHIFVRRIIQKITNKPQGQRLCSTSWGAELWCNTGEAIGRSVYARGFYDIVVSETLSRLLEPGSCFVDAGANIGVMTVLGAHAVGKSGQVLSFEPNPKILPILKTNVDITERGQHNGSIEVFSIALGSQLGEATLFVPPDYGDNDGIAHLGGGEGDVAIKVVKVTTLDAIMDGKSIDVLKIDVEGFELEALKGAIGLLSHHLITHIVFEDLYVSDSHVPDFLRKYGYDIYRLGYTFWGPDIATLDGGRTVKTDGAPSFLATMMSRDELYYRMRRMGWLSLRNIGSK